MNSENPLLAAMKEMKNNTSLEQLREAIMHDVVDEVDFFVLSSCLKYRFPVYRVEVQEVKRKVLSLLLELDHEIYEHSQGTLDDNCKHGN